MKKALLFFAVLLGTVSTIKLSAQALPAQYTQTNVITGLSYCVDWDWAPDGRYFISQKGGVNNTCVNAKVLVYSAAGVLIGTFCDVTDSSICSGERGLLGIVVDPNFTTNHYVYTYYVYKFGSANEIRVMRWTENANVGTNPTVIFRTDLTTLGFAAQPYHYAGMIRMHATEPDKIYICVGEMYHLQTTTTLNPHTGAAQPDSAHLAYDAIGSYNFGQQITIPYGKILRINTDGTIPTDNPFYDDGNPLTGKDDRIWSYGHRNMFGMFFSSVNDSLFEAENGLNEWDEFNQIHKGGNYGWNLCEGDYANNSSSVLCNEPTTIAPLTEWGAPVPSVTGCMQYTGSVMPEFDNHILVADNNNGDIHNLTMSNSPAWNTVTSNVIFANVAPASLGLTTLREGSEGCIYGMVGGYTGVGAGTIFKICPVDLGIKTNGQLNNAMGQNYPNPATGRTQIDYSITQSATVAIELYDVTGRKVKTILNQSDVTTGIHTIEIDDLNSFAAGSYFYKMIVKQNNKLIYTETKKLSVVR